MGICTKKSTRKPDDGIAGQTLRSGEALIYAALSLFHGSSNGSQYDVFHVTSPWSENLVSFDTAPAFDPIAAASLNIAD